jgi:hypothetical protein
MPPAVVFVETDFQVQSYHHRDDEDDWPTSGESWDDELIEPGRLVYVGQGQSQFVRADEPHPGMLYPNRRKKRSKKKKSRTPQPQPPPPPPASSPAPIDWDDWEELCQEAPPVPAPPPSPPSPPAEQSEEEEPSEPEDWEEEIACYHAAFHHQPEDWEAEIAASQWQPEDWMSELLE